MNDLTLSRLKSLKLSGIIKTLEELYMSWADNSYMQKIKMYVNPDLLILDRFVHHCHLVVIKGDSYRMRQSVPKSETFFLAITSNFYYLHHTTNWLIC